MVTLADIASRAGVSLSTVSRVLNGNPKVHPETRERVQKLMDELGYRPNEIARAMIRGKTQTLGLIVADITNPFYAETAKVVVSQARQHRYDVILCNTENDPALQQHYLDIMREKQVDGIIMASSRRNDPHIDAVIDLGVPVVFYNRRPDRQGSHYVVADNELGAYQATEHLIQLGHRRIAFLSGPPHFSTAAERKAGYLAAMLSARIAVQERWIQMSTFTEFEAYRTTLQLLNTSPRPTAIFAANDIMAFGVLECALEKGIRVPEEISVVGFDDINLASHRAIQLTTVAQRKEEMAQLAVKTMLQLLSDEGSDRPIQVVLRPELRLRGSTGPPPAGI